MRILAIICSLLVGSLFIVSGLIKANDALGFSYKLEEYFVVFEEELMPEQEVLQVTVTEAGQPIGSGEFELRPGLTTVRATSEAVPMEAYLSPRPDLAEVNAEGDTIIPNDTLQQSQFSFSLGVRSYGAMITQTADLAAKSNFVITIKLGDKELYSKTIEPTVGEEVLIQEDIDVSAYVKEPSFLVGWMKAFGEMALPLAMLICVVEIVLGVALLLGAKPGLTILSLLGMIVFFTFLTWYSAYYNKVTDCGCFGDALKLTPWESFSKDIILLVPIVILFFLWLADRGREATKRAIRTTSRQEDMVVLPISLVLIAGFSLGVIGWGFPILFSLVVFAIVLGLKYTVKNEWIMALGATALTFAFTMYCFWHLPLRDFRPYAVEKSITEGIKSAEELGLQPPEYASVYIMTDTNTGESFKINSKDYMAQRLWENKVLKLEATDEVITITEGYEPPIHDFNLYDPESVERTQDILSMPVVMLLISYDYEKADAGVQPKVNELVQASETNGGPPMIGLTATGSEKTEALRHEYQSAFPYYSADGTVLKTIVRSNPGLVLLKEGTVVAKWHLNDFPTFEELKQHL